ncbi:MAG TPA: hypothetical protein PLD59_15440 [Tepidisphaeraceae bacterium]|nr:hypothetical protein [Tepidisphaeraceae bacterium]
MAVAMGVGRPAAPESQILIAQLADDSFAVRERAQQELIETGEALVESIKAALAISTDEEQRQRLDSILKQISEDAVLGASRITLSMRDAPLDEVVAEINRQVRGAPVRYARDNWNKLPGPRVTLEARRQPLWAVLREICTQVGTLDISPGDDGVRLSLGCGALSRAPASVSGPMLIVASRIAHQKTVELAQGLHRTSDFAVHFTAIAEPKLKVMPGAATVRLKSALDDLGNNMLPQGHVDETYGGGSPFWSFQSKLAYPATPGRVIQRISGEITFNAASRFETIELTDWINQRGSFERFGDFDFVIQRVTALGDSRYEVTVAAVAPANDPDAYNRLQQVLYAADLRVFDAQGRAIFRTAGPSFAPTDRSNLIEMTSIFDRSISDGRPAPGEASTIAWRVPVETRLITVPFELNNLPMP